MMITDFYITKKKSILRSIS